MDELSPRIPNSPEAERAVIGSMLIDPECIGDVLKALTPKDFYVDPLRDMYIAIVEMSNSGVAVDPVTTLAQMSKLGLTREDTRQLMADILKTTPTAANVKEYVTIVSDRGLQRELSEVSQRISNVVSSGEGTAEMMLRDAETALSALRSRHTAGDVKTLSEAIQGVYDRVSEVSSKPELQWEAVGLTTGLIDLDKQILGLGPGELILIASRPGMGKTAIALNMAIEAARASGKAVYVFSLEMSTDQLATRVLSSGSLIPVQRLMKATINGGEWRRLVEAATELSKINMLIDDNPNKTVAEMKAQCKHVPNLGLVVIDYLQLMQAPPGRKNMDRQQVVAEMSRSLKIMAKELAVPVLCLSQLSRKNEERKDKRPLLSDLRDSGAIEQDADVVIGLYREGYYQEKCEDPNAAEAIVLKNRKGETGTVPLLWEGEFTMYRSMYAESAYGGGYGY